MKTYTISQVAEQFSLKPHTLRFYESEGLLKQSAPKRGCAAIRKKTFGSWRPSFV